MSLQIKEGLTFDDVLIVPRFSNIKTRKNIDLSVKLSKGLSLKHPIIPANMKTICGLEMAETIYKTGGMAIVHRFMSLKEQFSIAVKWRTCLYEKLENSHSNYIGFSIGAKEEDRKTVDEFVRHGAKILCIDIAHGDSEHCIEMTEYIANKYPDIFLIAGNVATGEGAKRLWLAGADCVKVGVGPGSLCTTRIETGNGVPQLTALADVAQIRQELTTSVKEYSGLELVKILPTRINKPIFIIADGGLTSAGNCVKALCFADMIMTGNIFAGSEETPGEIMSIDGRQYKNYVGSSTHKTSHVEGVSAIVPTKGKAADIVVKLREGITSGLSYQGCNNLVELREDPQFVKITNAGLKESHAHDVLAVK
jgi:IMP dehydrogenase